jgi:pyruvate/2-oxoglutarate dehydrogenase complex dihydrolipoamide acyltransferase (E2) component
MRKIIAPTALICLLLVLSAMSAFGATQTEDYGDPLWPENYEQLVQDYLQGKSIDFPLFPFRGVTPGLARTYRFDGIPRKCRATYRGQTLYGYCGAVEIEVFFQSRIVSARYRYILRNGAVIVAADNLRPVYLETVAESKAARQAAAEKAASGGTLQTPTEKTAAEKAMHEAEAARQAAAKKAVSERAAREAGAARQAAARKAAAEKAALEAETAQLRQKVSVLEAEAARLAAEKASAEKTARETSATKSTKVLPAADVQQLLGP